jgi:hypothetical protein
LRHSAHQRREENARLAALRTNVTVQLGDERVKKLRTENIRALFETDDKLNDFWALPYDVQRNIWGPGIDVTGFKDTDEFEDKKRQILNRRL